MKRMKRQGEKMTRWTQRRLDNVFREYNERYFDGRLKEWGAAIASPNALWVGFCEFKLKQLMVVTDTLPDDSEIQSTLLHEMAHAAARRAGHGYAFWEQIERLLQQDSPITL